MISLFLSPSATLLQLQQFIWEPVNLAVKSVQPKKRFALLWHDARHDVLTVLCSLWGKNWECNAQYILHVLDHAMMMRGSAICEKYLSSLFALISKDIHDMSGKKTNILIWCTFCRHKSKKMTYSEAYYTHILSSYSVHSDNPKLDPEIKQQS